MYSIIYAYRHVLPNFVSVEAILLFNRSLDSYLHW